MRPDAIVLYAVVTVLAWSSLVQQQDRKKLLSHWLMSGLLLAAVLIFQRSYYGDWLPNTYWLKATAKASSLAGGWAYTRGFLLNESFHLPLLLGGIFYLVMKRPRGKHSFTLLSVVCVWFAYVVWVGGDASAIGRFFVPIIPFLCALSALLLVTSLKGLKAEWRREKVGWRWQLSYQVTLISVMTGLFAYHVGLVLDYDLSRQEPSRPLVENLKVALALRQAGVPEGSVIGVFFAGTAPYFMPNQRFHDLLGKSDRYLARTTAHPGMVGHNKWDYGYSLGRVRPDLILTAAPFTDMSDQSAAREASMGLPISFHQALWLDPTFQREYRPNRIVLTLDCATMGGSVWVYARKGWSGLHQSSRQMHGSAEGDVK
jgi:hypothetical protein